ncbi:MotA/TolQ/ExbB proton channel family protein [Pseudooceanicola aestuarii]|uniref:MotA/TolQ/ExbB proton channel family protein n=1 Tax=Pseudooceanicola aestuarii TaxID=2697319 RepID=UPI0013CFD2C7|nr:MotA/TolQ/ExbB proton channel family protein [Pseudooceanicola aestuarii]
MTGRGPALVLAAAAAALFWIGQLAGLLGPVGAPWLSGLGGAFLAPPLFLLVAPRPNVLWRMAGGILAVAPVLAVLLMVLRPAVVAQGAGPAGAPNLDAMQAWPILLCAIAAGLALILMAGAEGRGPGPAPWFPTGAALFALLLSGLAMAGLPAQILTRTPIHAALVLLAAVILAGLLLTLADRALTPRLDRFLRALIGLLPLLGFTGTILGIMRALDGLPDVFATPAGEADLSPLLSGLATAFETTLIGLLAAVSAGFLLALLGDALTGEDP